MIKAMKVLNTKIKIFSGLLFICLLALIFTNASIVDWTIDNAKAESRELHFKIHSKKYNGKAKQILIALKVKVSNFIARKTNSKSCADLLEHDKFMMSGAYHFKIDNSIFVMLCEIENQKLISETFIKEFREKKKVCSIGESCEGVKAIKRILTCRHPEGSFISCSAPNLIKTPKLIESNGFGDCQLGETYGFDNSGVWVDQGCGGKFEVVFMSSAGLKNLIEYQPDFYEREAQKLSVDSFAQYNDLAIVQAEDSRVESIFEQLRQLGVQHTNIRTNTADSYLIEKRERSLEDQAERLVQELIHLRRYRTCNELAHYLPHNFTGSYFLYNNSNSFLSRHVSDVPTFCDYTKLILDDGEIARHAKNYNFLNHQAYGNNYYENINGKESILKKFNAFEEPTPFNGPRERYCYRRRDEDDCEWAPHYGFTPHLCVAKKDIQYQKSGSFSFVELDDLGDLIYRYKGISYCLNTQRDDLDNFLPNAGNIAHAYIYNIIRPTVHRNSSYRLDPMRDAETHSRKIEMRVLNEADETEIEERLLALMAPPKTCQYKNTIIEHGKSLMVFATNLESYPNTCQSGRIVCNDGELSGDTNFEYKNCTQQTEFYSEVKKSSAGRSTANISGGDCEKSGTSLHEQNCSKNSNTNNDKIILVKGQAPKDEVSRCFTQKGLDFHYSKNKGQFNKDSNHGSTNALVEFRGKFYCQSSKSLRKKDFSLNKNKLAVAYSKHVKGKNSLIQKEKVNYINLSGGSKKGKAINSVEDNIFSSKRRPKYCISSLHFKKNKQNHRFWKRNLIEYRGQYYCHKRRIKPTYLNKGYIN